MIFTRVYLRIIIGSILAGFLGTAAGYIISYFAEIPVGATIIFTLVVIWTIAKITYVIIRTLRK
jgi:zinc transport system permease protein